MSAPANDNPAPFDARAWLAAFTDIGGGYAVISGRQVAFIVDRSDTRAAGVIAQVTGRPGRLDDVRSYIELRQNGEAL